MLVLVDPLEHHMHFELHEKVLLLLPHYPTYKLGLGIRAPQESRGYKPDFYLDDISKPISDMLFLFLCPQHLLRHQELHNDPSL